MRQSPPLLGATKSQNEGTLKRRRSLRLALKANNTSLVQQLLTAYTKPPPADAAAAVVWSKPAARGVIAATKPTAVANAVDNKPAAVNVAAGGQSTAGAAGDSQATVDTTADSSSCKPTAAAAAAVDSIPTVDATADSASTSDAATGSTLAFLCLLLKLHMEKLHLRLSIMISELICIYLKCCYFLLLARLEWNLLRLRLALPPWWFLLEQLRLPGWRLRQWLRLLLAAVL